MFILQFRYHPKWVVLQGVTLKKGDGPSALQSKECFICYVLAHFQPLVIVDTMVFVAIIPTIEQKY